METLNPNNDAENRHSVGGRKRSSRRSSILKTAKSPLKMALEDIDPNSLGSGKENRDKRSNRSSSSRRVSFAETYQVKEFCKDEEWNAIWQRENSTITSDQAEQSDLSPSEYRQPTDRIRGLESLLKGDIQNTGQELQDQDELSMDFTFCGKVIEQSGRQSLKSLENNNQDQENRVGDEVNALELTCHGQGLINQDDGSETDVFKHYSQSSGSRKESILAQDMRRPGLSDYVQHYQTLTQREKARGSSNKENEGTDFNVCHGGKFDGPMSLQTTAVFDPKLRDVDINAVELTCHGQGLVRANAKSFLASLGKSKVGVSNDSASNISAFGQQDSSYTTSNINNTLALSIHGRTELPDVTEPEEDMEMTACLDVVQTDTKTSVNLNAPVPEEGMDMTACVPTASGIQNDHLAMSEGQMDITACVPRASRLQNDHLAMSEGQMDMTACVPPASRIQNDHLAMSEGQMDMTACVPPASRLQNDHLAMSEGQMDMTTCVPPASRLQNDHLAMSEGQMDMTACVPPASRLHGDYLAMSDGQMPTCVPPASRLQNDHLAMSEGQMDMTACVPPASRLQGDHLAMSEGQMDMTACVPPASRLQGDHLAMSEGQMDMTACVPPASRLHGDYLAMSEGQMDMTACVPPASRLQGDHLAMSDGQMPTCVPSAPFSTIVTDEDLILNKRSKEEPEGIEMTNPIGKLQLSAQDEHPPSGNEGHASNDTENVSCLKPAPSLVYQTDSRKRQSSSHIDYRLESEIPREKKKQFENHHDHLQRTNDGSSFTGPVSIDLHSSGNKKLGSSIQSWLNRSMPIVDQKKSQATFLRSLPTLSKSLIETDGPGNKNIPHATFAPVSNVPISKFCSQPAMKRKMIQIDHQDGFQGLSQTKCNTEEQTFASSSDVNHEDNSPKDSLKPDNAIETVQSCNQGVPQDDDDAAITFKDPICSMAGSGASGASGDKQTKEESVINGLMEEPTLEMDFTDQSAISVGLSALDDTSHQEGEEGVPTPSDDNIPSHTKSHDQSQQLAKQQAINLSVICEENEINSSKVADRTLMTGKHETSVKQKNMTVSELLSRANISFQNIEQISRRSTIAFLKKTEKPREEKEFIQLSLVKKPQAISYGDICTNIQKELEKLKETMDRQETELNESNTSILQQVDDSKMAKLEVTLKELKNICKKCAYRKWIRRTGAMKKKLAMTLKENYEVLSDDVRNIDETLLVTNDCLQLIEGIDDEIEKGIESLRISIEKSDMENADLDKVEATLHERKSQLESREEELKEMENQRSSLASSKGSLSSEKETLEREQLAHDEMLSQIKNKPSSCETNESLSEKYKLLEGCLEWELTEWNENHAKFLFLYDTLELRVDFHQSDIAQSRSSQPVAKKIQNISVSSQLADDSHLSARFVHSLVINSFDEELLHSSISNTSSLPKVLEHVSGLVIAARSLGNELFELNFQHILTMRENSIFIEFSSVKAFMKFIVQFTVNVCKYPDEVEITVIPKIGKCCLQEIQDALISVATGPKYMSRLVETARQFLDKK